MLNDQFEKAMRLYEKLVTLEPENPGYDGGLGEAYLRLGKYEKAVEHYEKALPDPIIPARLALAYIAIGREDKAVEIIRRFIATDEKQIPEVMRRLKQQLKK